MGGLGEAAARHPDLIPALLTALRDHPDSHIRSSVAAALGRLGEAAARHPDLIPALLTALRGDPNEWVRSRAAEALGRLEDGGHFREVAARLREVWPTYSEQVRIHMYPLLLRLAWRHCSVAPLQPMAQEVTDLMIDLARRGQVD
jgi:hypothetical protein